MIDMTTKKTIEASRHHVPRCSTSSLIMLSVSVALAMVGVVTAVGVSGGGPCCTCTRGGIVAGMVTPSSLGSRCHRHPRANISRHSSIAMMMMTMVAASDHCDDVDVGIGGRRSFLSRIAAASSSSSVVCTLTACWSPLLAAPKISNAAPLLPFINPRSSDNRRRQLELCLVTILRTEYWAMSVARKMKSQLLLLPQQVLPNSSVDINATPTTTDNTDLQQQQPSSSPPPEPEEELTEYQKKSSYLEARLGAKALLTQKIGGGANVRVVTLGSFQLKQCLEDVKYWCREYAQTNPSLLSSAATTTGAASPTTNAVKRICSNELSNTIDDLIESLASIVEFDGLETTIDPSPRSSLMLSMYNSDKGVYVYRTLMERVVPDCERILKVFDNGERRRVVVEEFVRRNYGDEIPR